MAAQYRCLQDCFVNGAYSLAGDVITLTGVPGPYLDPLTPDAVNAFYSAGPQTTVLARTQWSTQPVSPAVTYWQIIPNSNPAMWQLRGTGLPPIGGG
jgi:hypothetical protein